MIRKLIKLLYYALTAVSVLAVISPLISPKYFWPASVPGLFFNYLLILHALFFAYWVWRKDRTAFLSLAVFLLFAPYLSRVVSFYPVGSAGGMERVHMATYNIYGLKNYRKQAELDEEAVRRRFVADWRDMPTPDLLCVQEANGYVQKVLKQVLAFPHGHLPTGQDMALFSKHAIREKGEIDLPSRSGKCIWADLRIHGKDLRVYCVHLESNRVSLEADRLMREGNIQESRSWKDAFGLLKRYMTSARDRAREVEIIKEHLGQSPHPVILAGDINDTPISYTYQQLTGPLADVFVKNTRGWSHTYSGTIPFLRIDYIFADERCQVINYHVPRWDWSDHYPVFAEIALDSLGGEN